MTSDLRSAGPRRPLASIVRRVRSVDALFGTLATAFGLFSIAYPFGRDQGLFFYAAREWLERGQVLYRDVFDHKPPVIYFLHILTIAVLGQHEWGIRVVELVLAVPATGWVAARLATPRGEPIPEGTFGAAWLGAAIFQYGYLTYWDTAQCEIWYALFAVGGMTALLRGERHRYLVGGALAALSLFTKPPALPFVCLCVLALTLRVRSDRGTLRDLARATASFALGGIGVAAAILALMTALHAVHPMMDILVVANGTYLAHETGVRGVWDVAARTIDAFTLLRPFSSELAVIAGLTAFLGFAHRDPRLASRYAWPIALVLATFASVAMQLKFYFYHWGPAIAPAALFFAVLWDDCARTVRLRAAWLAPTVLLVFAAGSFLFSGDPAERWFARVRDTLKYETHRMDRAEFASRFDIPGFYSESDAELVASWLRARTSPEDTVIVRGFEPEIYALSGRHFTGRFFWSTFLTGSGRMYRRDQLLAEDRAEIERHPPRYAVALRFMDSGVDSPTWFEALGYTRRVDIGGFAILERPAALR
jgi:hypothetical protein